MPELTVDDLQTYTKGRLVKTETETARLLAAGLNGARRYCHWHVTPVRTADPFKLDGRGGTELILPTQRVVSLDSLLEDGAELNVDTDVEWSESGMVRKAWGGWWTRRYRGIEGTMTHGFADAPEWQAAVLAAIDRCSKGVGRRATVVGPFQYELEVLISGSAFTQGEKAVLDDYRIALRA